MNEEKINQILMNQRTIMSVLRRYSSDKEHNMNVSEICKRQMETLDLLEPVEQPKLSEQTKDALCENQDANYNSGEGGLKWKENYCLLWVWGLEY